MTGLNKASQFVKSEKNEYLYDMEKNNIFFAKEGEKGLNLTSASHLCAIANHILEQHKAVVENISFLNEAKAIVGSKDWIKTAAGCSDEKLEKIPKILEKIAEFNSFIAWFGEARKAFEKYKDELLSTPMDEWAREKGIEIPEKPEYPEQMRAVTTDDMIAELNIKERQTYLSLEAKASVLGKFIHPSMPMEEARKRLHQKIAASFSTSGSGRDTLITNYEASCDPSKVDKTYNQLQHLYRETEQALNHMKSDLQNKKNARNIEIANENRKMCSEYEIALREYRAKFKEVEEQYNAYLIQLNEEVSKIKLAIPQVFASTVVYLNNIDK